MMLALIFPFGNKAEAQNPISTAQIPEDVFTPTPNHTWDNNCTQPSHSNAGDYGNLQVSSLSDQFDLYVSTWDPSPGVDGDPGFLVRQYLAGTQIEQTSSTYLQDFRNANNSDFDPSIRSLEAGILKDGDNIYIALTYFMSWKDLQNYYHNDYFLELYKWDPVTGTLTQSAGPYSLSQSGSQAEVHDWIHQDVNGLNKIVITWSQGGHILTRAGEVLPNGVELGGTGILSSILPGNFIQPDVAMLKTTSGDINLYYSFTTADSIKLMVYKSGISFDSLFNINTTNNVFVTNPLPIPPQQPYPPLTEFPVPGNIVYDQVFNGKLGLPRIDAPDIALSPNSNDRWSVTVADHVPDSDYIYAITYDGISSSLHQTILNNGILIGNTTTGNLASNNNNYPENLSARPVVAFSKNGSDIFYAWVYKNPNNLNNFFIIPPFPFYGNGVYLSLKTTFDLQLINGWSPYKYFRVAKNPSSSLGPFYVGCSPSVALATQNSGNYYLYTSFMLWDQPMNTSYDIGLKTTEWDGNQGFRPSRTTGISSVKESKNELIVYPNPFRFSLSLKMQDNKGKTYDLEVDNLLGQKIYNDHGTLLRLNKNLKKAGEQLTEGNYFLKLSDEQGNCYQQKLIKL